MDADQIMLEASLIIMAKESIKSPYFFACDKWLRSYEDVERIMRKKYPEAFKEPDENS